MCFLIGESSQFFRRTKAGRPPAAYFKNGLCLYHFIFETINDLLTYKNKSGSIFLPMNSLLLIIMDLGAAYL